MLSYSSSLRLQKGQVFIGMVSLQYQPKQVEFYCSMCSIFLCMYLEEIKMHV
jgi:hypothetical protein